MIVKEVEELMEERIVGSLDVAGGDNCNRFGIDPKKVAGALRFIADGIENGKIEGLRDFQVHTSVQGRDFPVTSVELTFSETGRQKRIEEQAEKGA